MNRMYSQHFALPDDEWCHDAPTCTFLASDLVQVFDRAACAAMGNRFQAEAKAENFAGVLVDFDHFSCATETPSRAAGWVSALRNDSQGLWARVRWTDEGLAALNGGRYRFMSPVWRFAPGTAVH